MTIAPQLSVFDHEPDLADPACHDTPAEVIASVAEEPSLIPPPRRPGSDPAPTSPLVTRSQIVTRILELNPTASPAFLGHFDQSSLADYLEHLEVAQRPRDERGGWIRRGNIPAIVVRVPLD